MDTEALLRDRAPGMIVQRDVPMSGMTCLRVGGPAAFVAQIRRAEDAKAVFSCAKEQGLPVLVLGNGSNMLVSDAGFPGIVALMKNSAFGGISVWDELVCAQAGAMLSELARTAAESGLTGLECLSGIPGTVGGGVYMNCGAYGGQIADTVKNVTVLLNGEIEYLSREEMDFAYRHSRAMAENALVLGAEFELRPGDRDTILETMRGLNARRREKQPLEYPSAGSFFKRPEGYFAGALIEQAGLKGLSAGGAQVSEKHAGFLINRGGATAADFVSLAREVRRRVLERFGVILEPEVRLIGVEL